ncbi:hypothetical protein EOE18_15915 [Novosphingobium umbonatum]|uniref:Ubiquinol-cytochrome c chaperone domain-containing protein n=1 Tax=Novosphingobium umbonatum TaxID=1908524 RepID=A0A437N0I3_9SPHN|nr:ubiquinol-cytochrome C chaperone family protein [Novosphingobium umbonatum]RVU03436.1 hypothetical protein EOE18_15915 [Novosphingobium umbonatum]
MTQTTSDQNKPSLLRRLFGSSVDDHAAVRPFWHRVVELARAKAWYLEGGVADTLAGRFDVITLVLSLALLRMENVESLKRPSVLLTELFVTDMDGQLRESGVGDMVVGKHIGRLMSVLGGRLGAYREALAQDEAALMQALERNMSFNEGVSAQAAAALARQLADTLAAIPDDALLNAEIAA